MLDVASQVFGVRFPDDAVVGEDRRDLNSFLSPVDLSLPLPSPADLVALPDPADGDGSLDEVSRAVLGCDTSDAREMGRRLLAHPITHDLLTADVDQPLTAEEILAAFPTSSSWRVTAAQNPEVAAKALDRFIALISVARDPKAPADQERPLLLVETHLWVRSLSRVLRFVSSKPVFAWTDADQAATAAVMSAAQEDRRRAVARAGRLPSAYCRHCGRSGWSAIMPERNPRSLVTAPDDIYRLSAGGGNGKARVRALIAATPAEAAKQARQALGRSMQRGKRAAEREATVLVLEDSGEALRRIDPDEVFRADGSIAETPENGVFVKTGSTTPTRTSTRSRTAAPRAGRPRGSASSVPGWPRSPRWPSRSCSPAGSCRRRTPRATTGARPDLQRLRAGRGPSGRVRGLAGLEVLAAVSRPGAVGGALGGGPGLRHRWRTAQ